MKQSASDAFDVIQKNPIRREEMAAIDLDDIPDRICVSCWAWNVLRHIEAVPHTTCREELRMLRR